MSADSPKSIEEEKSRARVRAVIAASTPQDYDGHTEFERMSARARLEWLDAAVHFLETNRQRLSHVAEDPPAGV